MKGFLSVTEEMDRKAEEMDQKEEEMDRKQCPKASRDSKGLEREAR